jgi:hypothetical protein
MNLNKLDLRNNKNKLEKQTKKKIQKIAERLAELQQEIHDISGELYFILENES